MMLHIPFIRSPTYRRWMLFSCSPSPVSFSLSRSKRKERQVTPWKARGQFNFYLHDNFGQKPEFQRASLNEWLIKRRRRLKFRLFWTATRFNILYRSRNKARKRGRVNRCEYAFDSRQLLGRACKSLMNLGFWETAHLPLPYANINTYFSFRAKCWLRGGVGGQFPEP